MTWIKLHAQTVNKPEVARMARMLNSRRQHVLGGLACVWQWADQNCVNGQAIAPVDYVDEIAGFDGFAKAMEAVGWLRIDGEELIFPNFERHNGESAKQRALAAERQTRSRTLSRPQRDTPAAPCHAEGVTREEKRRVLVIQTSGAPPAEGKENPSKPTQTPDAERVSKAKTEIVADTPVFCALVEACGARLDEVTGPARFRYGKAVAEIRAATPDVTPDEIRRRAARYRDRFPRWALTAHALAKHWSQVGPAEHDHAAASAAAAADPDAPVQMPRYPKA
jgi:hypothetical protein